MRLMAISAGLGAGRLGQPQKTFQGLRLCFSVSKKGAWRCCDAVVKCRDRLELSIAAGRPDVILEVRGAGTVHVA